MKPSLSVNEYVMNNNSGSTIIVVDTISGRSDNNQARLTSNTWNISYHHSLHWHSRTFVLSARDIDF